MRKQTFAELFQVQAQTKEAAHAARTEAYNALREWCAGDFADKWGTVKDFAVYQDAVHVSTYWDYEIYVPRWLLESGPESDAAKAWMFGLRNQARKIETKG